MTTLCCHSPFYLSFYFCFGLMLNVTVGCPWNLIMTNTALAMLFVYKAGKLQGAEAAETCWVCSLLHGASIRRSMQVFLAMPETAGTDSCYRWHNPPYRRMVEVSTRIACVTLLVMVNAFLSLGLASADFNIHGCWDYGYRALEDLP